MHRIVVDHSEHCAPLLARVHGGGAFTVEMSRLSTGDYLIDERILTERETRSDFIASLLDGRTSSSRGGHAFLGRWKRPDGGPCAVEGLQ
jgi:ERCC4-type nuclease